MEQHGNWRVAAVAALEWWVDAGVDTLVTDTPRDWFASPAHAAAIARPGGASTSVPGSPAVVSEAGTAVADALPLDLALDLDAFLAWRMGPSAPEARWATPRFPALGPVDAELVVITDQPEMDDRDGEILSGASGRLLDGMLRAIGYARADVLILPLCWARPIGDHLRHEQIDLLGRIARHHLSLIPAKRAILLGQAVSRAIVGPEAPPRWGHLRALNHRDQILSAIGTFHPRLLLDRRHYKAEAWRDLQILTEDVGV